jgi:hypothetical protein
MTRIVAQTPTQSCMELPHSCAGLHATLAGVMPLHVLLAGLLPVPALVVACGARTGLSERGPDDASLPQEADGSQPVQDVSVEPSVPDADPPEVAVHDAGAPVPLIAVGYARSCVVRADGGVRCWGYRGDGTDTWAATATDVLWFGGPVVQLDIGFSATCARLQSEDVQCVGIQPFVVPGGGSTVPVTVPGLAGTLDVSVGTSHACVVVSGGSVRCWGMNDSGELGTNTSVHSSVPSDVKGLTESAVAVTAKAEFSCALLASGRVQCWGMGYSGQLGNGTTDDKAQASSVVPGIVGATAITNGTAHACVLTASGGVKCWGSGQFGQLGNGVFYSAAPFGSFTPVDVLGLAGPVKAIRAGEFSTCAHLANGGVQCWGKNAYGGLGDGSMLDRAVPAGVSGLGSVEGVGASYARGCVLLTNGGAKCWGIWALGNGTTPKDPPAFAPVDVLGLP